MGGVVGAAVGMAGSWGPRCAAIVLAGGTSARLAGVSPDKLAEVSAGRTLAQHVLDGVPADVPVAVVGPPRQLVRSAGVLLTTREEPAGSGPAAAVAAGLEALASLPEREAADIVVVLAGDAPRSPAAVPALLRALAAAPGACAAVALDDAGRSQVLLAAHRRPALAARVLTARGEGGLAGMPARWLLAGPVARVPVEPELLADVDTPADLVAWREG